MNRKKLITAVFGIVLVAGSLTGCGEMMNDERGRGDAPTGDIDESNKDVVAMPDRFANVAHACDGHGHRIFVTTRTDSGMQMEVIDDPSCGGPTG